MQIQHLEIPHQCQQTEQQYHHTKEGLEDDVVVDSGYEHEYISHHSP